MNEYLIEAPVTIKSGVLQLSKEQAKRRKSMLTVIDEGDGLYAVTAPVMFKAGETIGATGGNLPPVDYITDVESGMTMLEIAMAEKAERRRAAAGDDESVAFKDMSAAAGDDESVAFKDMSADQLKELVKQAGGEYTNKPDAIAFLEAKGAE